MYYVYMCIYCVYVLCICYIYVILKYIYIILKVRLFCLDFFILEEEIDIKENKRR